MPRESGLRVVVVYPELLGTYGDTGNARVLTHRCTARQLDHEVVYADPRHPLPRHADLYLLGGGEDANQVEATRLLRADGGLAAATRLGATVLAVCAGFQILGESFAAHDGTLTPGLGLLDVRSTALPRRAVGDVVASARHDLGLPPLLGFENHGGLTTLGPAARPFGSVSVGIGNGDPQRSEGAVQDRITATYLHGPVLALNPALADLLVASVVGPLSPVDDSLVDRLRTDRMGADRLRRGRPGRRRPARAFGRVRAALR